MGLTLGGPALEDSLAIRPRGCRHDRHARPVAAGGGQQRSVHLGHSLGVNSPEPTSAMTPPMAAESTGAAPRGASDSPDEEAPRGRGTSTLEATEHESDRHPHLKLDLL